MEEGLALLYNSANPLPLQKLLAIDKEENKEATSSPRVDLGNDLSRDSQQFHTSNSTSQFEVSAKFSLSDLDQNILKTINSIDIVTSICLAMGLGAIQQPRKQNFDHF